MSTVFAPVSVEPGLNLLPTNPCQLLDFALLRLDDGQSHTLATGAREYVAVILGGKATVSIGDKTFAEVGERASVFDGAPHAIYFPCDVEAAITGAGPVEIALCSAPSDLQGEAYHITPQQVTSGVWGRLNFTRNYHQILTAAGQPDLPARRLIVGETYTPGGNWSTYPAHRHEIDDLPEEAFHEEMYFFRVMPEDGIGITRYYHGTNDSEDDAVNFTVRNNTILMLPDGYHTYVGAPGFDSYYLWFLAGEHRQQAVVEDEVQAREVSRL